MMIRCLLAALLVLVAGLAGSAHAAAAPAAPSLAGRAYNITVFTDKDKILDKLTFTAKDLTAATIGFSKVAYTISPETGKHHKNDIDFTAVTKDGDGNTLKISGTASGNEVSGTIERTTKKGDTKTLQFSGGNANGGKK